MDNEKWKFKKRKAAKEYEWRVISGQKRKRKLERRSREVREKSQKRAGEREIKKLRGPLSLSSSPDPVPSLC